jgi:type I thyroxine 5'-deiodinase
VYIQEAHPTDLWQVAANVRDNVLFASPQNDNERNATASACVRKLGIRIPALLDGIENRAERAYTGWPDRLYVVGRDGRVVFKSRPGPYGFSSKELGEALRDIAAKGESTSASTARAASLRARLGTYVQRGSAPARRRTIVGQDCILPADFQSAEAPVANRRAA